MAGPPKKAPRSIPRVDPINPMTRGAAMNPGMIADLGIPRVLRIAISLDWDCMSLCRLRKIVIPATMASIPVIYGNVSAAYLAS